MDTFPEDGHAEDADSKYNIAQHFANNFFEIECDRGKEVMESFNNLLEEGLIDPLLQYLVKPTDKENEYKLNIETDNESDRTTDDEESIIKGKTSFNDSEMKDREK